MAGSFLSAGLSRAVIPMSDFAAVEAALVAAEFHFAEFRLVEAGEWIIDGETVFVDLKLTAVTPGGAEVWVCTLPNSGMAGTLAEYLAAVQPPVVRALLQEIVRLQNLVAFLQPGEATP